MIRLEREDFEDAKQLAAKLAAVIKVTPDEFKKRFGYLNCRHQVSEPINRHGGGKFSCRRFSF